MISQTNGMSTESARKAMRISLFSARLLEPPRRPRANLSSEAQESSFTQDYARPRYIDPHVG